MADGILGTESKKARAYGPDKDYISTLLLELGQANAIVDLLFVAACEQGADSLCDGTLESPLHNVLERLRAVKGAATAILDEQSAAHAALTSATG
jgi:hypothetical protein